jgi:orotidine-5'-phosphate decarboxylase
MKTLTPLERLIVAADFKPAEPNKRFWVRYRVLQLAEKLRDTGVCIKVESALRASGNELVKNLHELGLKVFADLKLCGNKETLSVDGVLLSEVKPDLLTVMCGAGELAIQAVKKELPNTEILAVTVLTSFGKNDSLAVHGRNIAEAVRDLSLLADRAGADGLVCSGFEIAPLREEFGRRFTLNVPNIRPIGVIIQDDDQNPERTMTPKEAIKSGADRIIVGRPITRNKNPRDAAMRIIEEIAEASIRRSS